MWIFRTASLGFNFAGSYIKKCNWEWRSVRLFPICCNYLKDFIVAVGIAVNNILFSFFTIYSNGICLVTFISFISYIKVHLIHFVIHFHLIHFVYHSPFLSHLHIWLYSYNSLFNFIFCFTVQPIPSL